MSLVTSSPAKFMGLERVQHLTVPPITGWRFGNTQNSGHDQSTQNFLTNQATKSAMVFINVGYKNIPTVSALQRRLQQWRRWIICRSTNCKEKSANRRESIC
jgi:hypothetical protein